MHILPERILTNISICTSHPVADSIKESSTFNWFEQLSGDVLDDSFICGRCDGHNHRSYTDYSGFEQQLELYATASNYYSGYSVN